MITKLGPEHTWCDGKKTVCFAVVHPEGAPIHYWNNSTCAHTWHISTTHVFFFIERLGSERRSDGPTDVATFSQ
jgi:hypothetical protein